MRRISLQLVFIRGSNLDPQNVLLFHTGVCRSIILHKCVYDEVYLAISSSGRFIGKIKEGIQVPGVKIHNFRFMYWYLLWSSLKISYFLLFYFHIVPCHLNNILSQRTAWKLHILALFGSKILDNDMIFILKVRFHLATIWMLNPSSDIICYLT